MILLLNNLEGSIFDADLRRLAAMRLGLAPEDVAAVRILRRALDARQHRNVKFVYSLAVTVPDVFTPPAAARAEPWQEPAFAEIAAAHLAESAPVVIGAGPAGLFAAFALCAAGLPPLIVERGQPVPERALDVNRFWDSGVLNPECNVYFGEGGAGTFSDGKLNTRTKHAGIGRILAELVAAGAPADILYDSHPHLGTDRLLQLLPALRRRLIERGAVFRFGTRLTDLRRTAGGRLEVCLSSDWVPAWPLVVACGHSAFDTYRLLAARGVELGTKGNAFGCRLEHPAGFITERFYGPDPRVRELLGHAHYNVAVPVAAGRGSTYSFCCCPGGEVVTGAAVPGQVSVNGMSFSRRGGPFTNAGLVTAVVPEAFAESAEAALNWREELERRCFAAGGGGFGVPGQRAADFVAGRASTNLPPTSSRRPVTPADLGALLPAFLAERLREGLRALDRKMPGWIETGVLLGVETTTSAPVRMVRSPQGESVSMPGLLPVGEGSGYAGGIVTSALDGYETVAQWLAAGRG